MCKRTKMRITSWVCGHTLKDMIGNNMFREKVCVALIKDNIIESRLRWFVRFSRRQ